jgi:hypothetical protein
MKLCILLSKNNVKSWKIVKIIYPKYEEAERELN